MLVVLIVLIATTIGAICGMGGGVIIKPLLDAVTDFSSFQISVISGCCVFAMSVASLIKHAIAKTKFEFKTAICLSIGSILGGYIGGFIFDAIEASVEKVTENAQPMMKIIQNSLLCLVIIFVLFYMIFLKKRNVGWHLKNPIIMVAIGLLLGTISVFLDIGGGPINVCVMILLFGMDNKQASINSLITIFFAQATKLVTMGVDGSFATKVVFDEKVTVFMLVALIVLAVGGGILGAILNKKLPNKSVGIVYCSALGFVLCISAYNIISNAILL